MGSKAPRVGLAEVLRRHGQAYLATHTLSPGVAKAWRAICVCRTAALGGYLEGCDQCGTMRQVYHSCRNRHCPLCQTRAKEAWLSARRRELLPVPYFHLVFTLPHALNGLIARHPRALYTCLFAAVSGTLCEFAANSRWLGGKPVPVANIHAAGKRQTSVHDQSFPMAPQIDRRDAPRHERGQEPRDGNVPMFQLARDGWPRITCPSGINQNSNFHSASHGLPKRVGELLAGWVVVKNVSRQ